MSAPLQFALLGALVLAFVILCARPLGLYIADVMEGKPNFALRWGAPLERWIYRACGIDARSETGWSTYTIGLLVFNLAGAMVVYALQRLQQWLPLNPQHFPAVSADSSFNTAMAFVTNTDWQGYSGESTMGYLTQAAGLAVQNFLSAATGTRRRHRPHPRFHPAIRRHHRQFLGRRHPIFSLCAVASRGAPRGGPHRSRRDPECASVPRGHHDRKADLRQSENRQRGQAALGRQGAFRSPSR